MSAFLVIDWLKYTPCLPHRILVVDWTSLCSSTRSFYVIQCLILRVAFSEKTKMLNNSPTPPPQPPTPAPTPFILFLPPINHTLTRHLYLGSSYDKFIRVYRLDPATKGAQLLQKVQIHGMGDNIVLSQSGDALIVGTQPNMLKHLDHEKSPIDMRSPSSVSRTDDLVLIQ